MFAKTLTPERRFFPYYVCSLNHIPFYNRVNPLPGPEGGIYTLKQVLERMPRTEVKEATSDYLYAVCLSKKFQFPDDMEFHLSGDGVIHVCSAARKGNFDFQVNRLRMWKIRGLLAQREGVEP